MAQDFYIYKPSSTDHACLKIKNTLGEELSVSFDNSCGAALHLSRSEVARFGAQDEWLDESRPLYSAEDFLHLLAAHLGFDAVKR